MGSTFVVRIPLAPLNIPHADQLHEVSSAKPLKGKKILAVDDMPSVLELLDSMLKNLGAQVILASSAHQAIDLVKNESPDILISDISMPGQDGYELIREIRKLPQELGGRIPAIALSAHADPVFEKKALESGYQLYLVKPSLVQSLVQSIKSVLAA